MRYGDEIELPQSEKEFDSLVEHIVKKFKFKDKVHTAAIIANRIMHLPVDQAKAKVSYLADCVKKNISYQTAQKKFQKINETVQVDQLASLLKENAYDQKALDDLTKLAESSEYARETLKSFVQEPSLAV